MTNRLEDLKEKPDKKWVLVRYLFIISLLPIYNARNNCGLIYFDIDVEIVARSDLRLRKLARMFEIDGLADINSGITQMKSSTAKRRSHLRRPQLMIPMRRTHPAKAAKIQKKINRLKLLTPHRLIRMALFIGVGNFLSHSDSL